MATYEKVKEAADYIKSKIDYTPKIAIICGSGLSKIGSVVEESIVIQYKSIPSFVTTSVQGHKNQLVLGKIKGKPLNYILILVKIVKTTIKKN